VDPVSVSQCAGNRKATKRGNWSETRVGTKSWREF